MRRIITLASAIVGSCAVLAAAGCPTRDVSNLAPHEPGESRTEVPISINRDIDILFVIDNSGSMSQEQTQLITNFPRFINVLETIPGGLPNVHIGIVSSNVGIAPFQTNGCLGNGDDGRLQNAPRGACTPPSGYYISDVLAPDGTTRIRNYPDTTNLEDVFSCIAELGTLGCGFEQHFESMKRALDGHRPENAGFLRDNAYLAVILVADEDDCSAKDGTVFDPSQDDLAAPLGPFTSFRCTEFGIECDGSPISRSPASYENCQPMPADQADYIQHPDAYADFLKSLKPDPLKIIVAGIIGNPTPVNVGFDDHGDPELLCSCGCSPERNAVASVRMSYFLDQFPNRATFTSICDQNLSSALDQIAFLLKRVLGRPCLDGSIVLNDIDGNPDNGIQLDCQVSDVVHKGMDGETSTTIPRCTMLGPTMPDTSVVPCWWVEEEPTLCTDTPTHMLLHVERAGDAPEDTTIVASCLTEQP